MKCEHGVYLPAADAASGKSWGCSQCWPDGHPETTQVPIMPRSSADALGRDSARETCSACGNIRTYFSKNCRRCSALFPEVESHSITTQQNTRTSTGACPNCRSTIHYETNKVSKWICADCDTEYTAPITQRRVKQKSEVVCDEL